MNILIYDIESNGLPLDKYAPVQQVDNWPRVIQIGWEKCNEQGEVLTHYSALVKPDGWEIPKEKFWIEHGYSTEQNIAYGVPMPDILELFIEALEDSEVLVAHNQAFDHPVLCAEMIRYEKKAKRIVHKVCTMEASVDFCKIPFGNDHRPWKNKTFKFPKLQELHKKLFADSFEGAHDAGSDVSACRKCFFELLKRKIIVLDDIVNTVRA